LISFCPLLYRSDGTQDVVPLRFKLSALFCREIEAFSVEAEFLQLVCDAGFQALSA